MKFFIHFLTLVSLTLVFASGCKKEDDPDPVIDDTKDTTTVDTTDHTPKKTRTEILAKKWIVDEAYVNETTPDMSSKGLTLDVRMDGSYTLSTGYVGTWEFMEDETKIHWDKGQSFHQIFTLDKFEEKLIDATFVSGFTHQNARWVLIPF